MAQNTKATRSPVRAIVIAAVIGLVVGLLGGLVAQHMSKPHYNSSTTFSVAPAPSGKGKSEEAASQQLAQLSSLTPIASGRTQDTGLRERIDEEVGRKTQAEISPSLIPDSPLLFQVQVRADNAKDATDTAKALEKQLPEDPTTKSVMDSSKARIVVVSQASEATSDASVPGPLIVAGSTMAGGLIAVAITMAYQRSARRKKEQQAIAEERHRDSLDYR